MGLTKKEREERSAFAEKLIANKKMSFAEVKRLYNEKFGTHYK